MFYAILIFFLYLFTYVVVYAAPYLPLHVLCLPSFIVLYYTELKSRQVGDTALLEKQIKDMSKSALLNVTQGEKKVILALLHSMTMFSSLSFFSITVTVLLSSMNLTIHANICCCSFYLMQT